MNNVIKLKHYTHKDDIDHVMYNRQEIEQVYDCPTCGELQVIGGVVWHIRPIEEHDND